MLERQGILPPARLERKIWWKVFSHVASRKLLYFSSLITNTTMRLTSFPFWHAIYWNLLTSVTQYKIFVSLPHSRVEGRNLNISLISAVWPQYQNFHHSFLSRGFCLPIKCLWRDRCRQAGRQHVEMCYRGMCIFPAPWTEIDVHVASSLPCGLR